MPDARRNAWILGLVGLIVVVASISPWAHRPSDPLQAVFAGDVGVERLVVRLLGLTVIFAAVIAWRRGRRSAPVWAATASALIGVIAIVAMHDVRAIVSNTAEVDAEVGWSLYLLCMCSVVGLASSCRALADASSSYGRTAGNADPRSPTAPIRDGD